MLSIIVINFGLYSIPVPNTIGGAKNSTNLLEINILVMQGHNEADVLQTRLARLVQTPPNSEKCSQDFSCV